MYKTTPKKTQASGSGGGGSVLQHDSPHPVWRVTAGERERETNRQTHTYTHTQRERERERKRYSNVLSMVVLVNALGVLTLESE